MWSSLLTLVLVACAAAMAYPQAPPQGPTEEELDNAAVITENFNPAQGNSYHNISCVGNRYALELPLQDGWDPNERTLQELCAKPQYFGGPPGQHVGGWCNHNEVVFDDSPGAQINPELANPRVLLGCRYRCFCNHIIPVEDRKIQPKPSESQRSLQVLKEDRSSSLTYEIRLDIQNDFTMPIEYNQGSWGDEEVDVVRISHFPEIRHPESLEQPHIDYVSEDPGNKITCSGSLPSFPLPSPYSVLPPNSDFENNQQLCAIQLNGGLLGANAGGYCHRSDFPDPTSAFPSQTVWFSDEMTPRVDWTWDGGYFFASASIRMHCYLNCNCSLGKTDKTPTERVWRFVDGHQLALRDNGQIDLEDSAPTDSSSVGGSGTSGSGGDEPDPKRIRMTVLPKQNDYTYQTGGLNSTAGLPSGGPSGNPLVPQAWPTRMLGPVPSAPPNATEVVKYTSSDSEVGPGAKNDLTICGNQCHGPQDCAPANEGDHACTCAFPNTHDAKWLGLDPIMPVSVCLVLMHAAFGKTGGGSLNGRDTAVGLYLDSEGQEWQCRCNATYTHNQCCGSRDGMIWLE